MATNHEKLMGTPETTAQVVLGMYRHSGAKCLLELLYEVFGYRPCTGCPFFRERRCCCNEEGVVVDWLESEEIK